MVERERQTMKLQGSARVEILCRGRDCDSMGIIRATLAEEDGEAIYLLPKGSEWFVADDEELIMYDQVWCLWGYCPKCKAGLL